jgi:hypothetical protein
MNWIIVAQRLVEEAISIREDAQEDLRETSSPEVHQAIATRLAMSEGLTAISAALIAGARHGPGATLVGSYDGK